MHSSVEKPSTLIAIRPVQTYIYKENKAINKRNTCLGKNTEQIDFYAFNKDERHKLLSDSFFENIFKNDIRIKIVIDKNGKKILCFINLKDAIDFYKQFYNILEMYFIHEENPEYFLCGFESKLDHITLPFCKTYEKNNKNQKIIINTHKNKNTNNEKNNDKCKEYTKEEFVQKIDYYNKLKHFYSKSDAQKIKILLKDLKTDVLKENTKDLCVGIYTNVILQEFLSESDNKLIEEFLRSLENDISIIACTKYGAYVIQKLISLNLSVENKRLLCRYFTKNAVHVICDDIGNYSIQKLLKFDFSELKEIFIKNLKVICGDKIGSKVLNKNIEYFTDSKKLIEKELNNFVNFN
ncbi:hypothetical protein EHP00_1743 [Ecytonucleospora hepatopenaei]|uniref:PUM-HD domain-containing protein n=1 Tax=Ecytonucleospora hepatopenaei TaxID=646526 RepID=A0A1W0E400_9MICR|nr:hypothetical protein EHP00_1743 [Ecytonucleospora hepatopenaei]